MSDEIKPHVKQDDEAALRLLRAGIELLEIASVRCESDAFLHAVQGSVRALKSIETSLESVMRNRRKPKNGDR